MRPRTRAVALAVSLVVGANAGAGLTTSQSAPTVKADQDSYLVADPERAATPAPAGTTVMFWFGSRRFSSGIQSAG